MLRSKLHYLGCLLALTLLGGCSPSESNTATGATTGEPQHGGTIYFGAPQEPPIINTYLANGGMGVTQMIVDPMHDKWVRVDDLSQWQPDLAVDIPTVENGGVVLSDVGTTIRFDIRPEATWSDGVPITCDDFAFTWKTIMNPRWQIGTRLGWEQIDNVYCEQRKTVTFHMKTRYAPFLSTILDTAPLPAHELRGKNFNQFWNNRHTVTSGPFMFKSWNRGVELVEVRNPNYWNAGATKRPYLDRLVFKFMPDPSTIKLQMRMNRIDMTALQPDTHLPEELRSIKDTEVSIVPGAGWEQVTFNVEKAPTNNVHVRKALAMSIDRKTITDVILLKQTEPLQSTLLPSQEEIYEPLWTRYNANRPRVFRELKLAGYIQRGKWWYKDGKKLEVKFLAAAGNPLRSKVAQLVQQQLERNGIAMHISLQKPEVFFSQYIVHGLFDMAVFSFRTGADPGQAEIFSCAEIPRKPNWAGKNDFRYCNRAVDSLIEQADSELDIDKRTQMLREIQRLIVEDIPTLPLYEPPDTLAYHRKVQGVRPNAIGLHTWLAEDWWVSSP